MGLKDIGENLPPGFRFNPSDEELICHYLYKKIANEEILKGTLVEVDLHTCEPWQLPDVAKLNGSEWYFFNFRDRKYATGSRTNRATTRGYWKATGKDRVILDPNTRQIVGMRKTLVFYMNRAPNGMKTGWIMHEFRFESPHMPPKEDWVLCRVFHKGKGESNHVDTSSSSIPTNVKQNYTMSNYKYQASNSMNLQPSQTVNDHPPLLNPNNLHQFLKEGNSSFSFNDVIMEEDHDHEDGVHKYGLLWEMPGFEEDDNLGHGIPHKHDQFDGMGFEDNYGVVL
ncbi:hypothetical protein V2J09_004930 [Rumex salicifolius]